MGSDKRLNSVEMVKFAVLKKKNNTLINLLQQELVNCHQLINMA
jgi:hypothetical protein